jgi:beta-phosphoglucomutase family hydrolase
MSVPAKNSPGPLGLPDTVDTCLFDLDGVLTQTAKVHAAAWKQMFDAFLRSEAVQSGADFVPFSIKADYTAYVDGRPRLDGTKTFLVSRGVHLPTGDPDDPPGARTLWALSNQKNNLVQEMIRRDGVETYAGSVRYVRLARDSGMKTAVVSSSANTKEILEVTGITGLFDTIVDANVAGERGLAGKPAPDTFLAGAEGLGAKPSQCAVFEDAIAGVQAGRAGNFGYVVGVDRAGHADALKENGADIVVTDLKFLIQH